MWQTFQARLAPDATEALGQPRVCTQALFICPNIIIRPFQRQNKALGRLASLFFRRQVPRIGLALSYAIGTRQCAIMPPLTTQTPHTDSGNAAAATPAFDEQAARVLRQFRLIFNTVRRHFQTMEKHSGIGGAQVWALSLVAQHQGLGVTQLADLMDIHQSTTSNLVKSLIKIGLLHSEKSSHDRRVVELYVLPDGLKLLKKIPGPFSGVLPHALQRMDEVTLLQLEHNLAALINRLEVDEKAAQTPIAMM